MPDIKRDQQGVDRCQHIIETVMQNDPKNPAAGFRKIKAYCNKPITFSIAEGRKVCPECDKQPPVGWVAPRKTNATDTMLTPKEMEECGLNPDGTRIDGKPITKVVPQQTIEAPQAVEAKVEVKKDEVSITVTLSDIEGTADIAALLIRRVSEGMDKLPVQNFGESKRLIKLQEKLESLLGA